MASGMPLWLGLEGDKNEFMHYLAGGFTLVYLICLILSLASRRIQPSVVVIPPVEDVEDEKTLHKYILTIHTSLRLGSSCAVNVNVFVQLMGERATSQFYKVKVFTRDRFLFQRGAVDIFLFKTKEYLGAIREIKILISGERNIKWQVANMEVLCLTSRHRYTVGYRLLNTDCTNETVDGKYFPCQTLGNKGNMESAWRKVVLYHHWFSAASHCLRYGKFTALVNLVLLFFSLSSLMIGSLIGYIITLRDPTEDSYDFEVNNIAAGVVATCIVFVLVLFMDLLFRNIKSGNQKKIDHLFPKNFSTDNIPKDAADSSGWHFKQHEAFQNLEVELSQSSLKNVTSRSLKSKENERNLFGNRSKDFRSENSSCVRKTENMIGTLNRRSEEFQAEDGSVNNIDVMKTMQKVGIPSADDSLKLSSEESTDQKKVTTARYITNQVCKAAREAFITRGTRARTVTSLQEQRLNEVKGFIEWLLLDIIKTVEKTKNSILIGNQPCDFDVDRIKTWYKEMEHQTLLHVNHKHTVEAMLNKKSTATAYLNIKKELPLNILRHIIVDIIQTEVRIKTSNIGQAIQEEIAFNSRTRLNKCADKYIEEQPPSCHSIVREAESKSVIPTLETELKPVTQQTSIDVPSSVSDTDDEDVWTWSLTSCGSNQANSSTSYDTGKQITVEVIMDSESPYLITDWRSVYPSCQSVEVVNSEGRESVIRSDSPSEKPVSVASFKRREDSCQVIDSDEPCVTDNIKTPESKIDCPVTVSDTTQYEFSKKRFNVVSNVSDPGLDFCCHQGNSITNISEQQQNNKQKEDRDIKGLIFFFLQQVLKLIFLTHDAKLCSTKLDKSTAKLAIILGENFVRKSGKTKKYNHVPDETDIHFNEFLAVVSLCDQMVNCAKLELWSEFQDPVYVYSHFLMRQTVISSLERLKTKVSEETEIEHFKIIIEALNKSWHKQGFHKTVNASRNLAQTLITNYVSNRGMNSSKVYSSILSLRRLENKLTRALEEYVVLVLQCWWSQRRIRKLIVKDRSLSAKLDWINAWTDVATQKMVSCLPSAVVKIVNEEILILTASNLCQDIIRSALYTVRLQAQDHSDAKHKYIEDDIVKMLTFLIDNIFVEFAGQIFQQVIGIPMGTNCAPLLADLFLYSYEAEFIQGLLAKGEKKLAQTFNFSFRYIDDLLSLNNPRFHDFTHLIYPKELELKDTTDTPCSSSYLDLFLKYDPNGKLYTRIYDKRDDFNFSIVNFPFLCSNIPASPAYGVYISQLIRYDRACSNYEDFIARGQLLTTRLQHQGYTTPRLKSTFRKFFGRQHDIVGLNEKSASDLEPVQSYLKFVTQSENLKSKQGAENGYIQRYQYKHKNFAMVYLQNVTDSFYIMEEANVDKTLTENVLYELEWYVMHENTKILPGVLKGFMVFLLFCLTLLNMAYIFFTGSYLSITQIKEWVTSFVLCLAIHGLLLEPLCAIIIGKIDSRHKRRSRKNVTAQQVDV